MQAPLLEEKRRRAVTVALWALAGRIKCQQSFQKPVYKKAARVDHVCLCNRANYVVEGSDLSNKMKLL